MPWAKKHERKATTMEIHDGRWTSRIFPQTSIPLNLKAQLHPLPLLVHTPVHRASTCSMEGLVNYPYSHHRVPQRLVPRGFCYPLLWSLGAGNVVRPTPGIGMDRLSSGPIQVARRTLERGTLRAPSKSLRVSCHQVSTLIDRTSAHVASWCGRSTWIS